MDHATSQSKTFVCAAKLNQPTNLVCREVSAPRTTKKTSTRTVKTLVGAARKCNKNVDCTKLLDCEPCLLLDRYDPPPPTDEVYDQYMLTTQFDLGAPVAEDLALQVILRRTHPLAERLSGVFGYEPDGTLSEPLNAGKLYNDHVTETKWVVHGVDPSQRLDLDPEVVLDITGPISDHFSSRGFQLAPPDTFESNERQFNFRSNITQTGFVGTPVWLINISFHFGESNPNVPSAVDLVGLSQTEFPGTPFGQAGYKGVAPYENDPEKRDSRFNYPIRIPLTTDCEEFNHWQRQRKASAFLNLTTNQVTITARNMNYVPFFDDRWPLALPPVEFTTLEYRMKGFNGKFQFVKRDRANQLVSSNVNQAEYFIQVSETVEVGCTELYAARDPPLLDLSYTINRTTAGFYSGAVISRINGGSPDYDIYVYQALPFGGGASDPIDPQITLSCHCGSGKSFETGDNSNTILLERLSKPSNLKLLDSTDWFPLDRLLSEDFFLNPPLPEDIDNFPPAVESSLELILANIMTHEYMHSTQHASGIIVSIDSEGQAVGMEFDPRINHGDYFTGRTFDQARFISLTVRGLWPLLESESDNNNLTGVWFGTYGGGLWWYWLMRKYDPEHQVMRRTNDIMATKWQVFQEQIEKLDQNWLFYGGANRLSAQQALLELHGLDFSEIYPDFAISLSLLRNNQSIPEQWRSEFPFWMAQPDYSYAIDVAGLTPEVAFWWHEFDNNINPYPASQRVSSPVIAPGGRFPTFLIQLDGSTLGIPYIMAVEDLSSNIFVVDPTTIEIVTVENELGRITVTMHQFTPTEGPDFGGTFTSQGPFELADGETQTFNVRNFTDVGLIRLVVSNVAITDFGGINNVIIDSDIDRISGRAIITTA